MRGNLPSILMIGLSLLVAYAAVGADDTAEPVMYDLAFYLEHGGDRLGEPRMFVQPGETAQIEVASSEEEPGYRVEVVARPAQGDGGIDVATRFFRMCNGEWRLVSEPRMVVAAGEPTTLDIGDGGCAGEPLGIKLVAQPIDRDGAEKMRQAWEASKTERQESGGK